MIILGIDPGFATVGWGVIKSEKGNSTVIDYGVITTPKEERMPTRLAMLEVGIKKLIENGLFNTLPDDLQETAKMRLNHPDMSMAQLALHSTPQISKSGITHRMARIMKIGKELLAKYDL